MKSYVSTQEILKAALDTVDSNFGTDEVPDSSEWHYGSEITIDSIKCWEKIYYEPTDLGIYAAHDPYVEYYIIVPYMFTDCIEYYYGLDAATRVYRRAQQIGINLELNSSWIPLEKMSSPSE